MGKKKEYELHTIDDDLKEGLGEKEAKSGKKKACRFVQYVPKARESIQIKTAFPQGNTPVKEKLTAAERLKKFIEA